MSGFSFLLSLMPKAVLLMTDDGVSVHLVKGGVVTYIGSEPWRGESFEARLSGLLQQVAGASVTVLNDAVEQHYRKEKVVVVTMLDKKNMVQRRLNVAFPNYSMRAAIALKGEPAPANAKTGAPKGDSYLFAAVPSTESYSRLMKALGSAELGLSGYGLLPVESVLMVKALAAKLAQRWGGTSGAAWSILIGQHHGGGLRQIVIKNGELALTRVTPIEEPNPSATEVWAGDVSQELQATLSYLSRFGYSPEDGINIMVVGEPSYTAPLEDLITVPCNFEAISASEAGKLLGVKLRNTNGDDHYADGLHAGWSASKLSLTLPLTSREMQAIANPYKTEVIFLMILNLAFAVLLFLCASEVMKFYKASRNYEVAISQKAIIDKMYNDEVERKEKMGIDVHLITSSLSVNSRLEKSGTDLLKLLEAISHNLETIRIDEMKFEVIGEGLGGGVAPSGGAVSPAPTDAVTSRPSTLTLKISFAGNINPTDGNKEIEKLRLRISDEIGKDGFVVTAKPLEDQTYKGELTEEVGLTANARKASERYESEIVIQRGK